MDNNREKKSTNKLGIYILIVVLAVFAFLLFGLQQQYDRSTKTLREKVVSVTNSKIIIQEALKNAVRKKRVYKIALQEEGKRAQLLNTQVSQLLSSEQLNKKRAQALDTELRDLKVENNALKDAAVRLSQEKNDLKEQLNSFQKIQANLQEKIKRLLTRTNIELGQVVVTPSALIGKIIKANQKYNFIIIDLGKNDGMQVGMNFAAYRQDNLIGEISIEKVYDELSVGKANFKWAGDELDAGDTIRGKD